MKHRVPITILLLTMFLVTQAIGLFVIHTYTPVVQEVIDPTTGNTTNITLSPEIPYGLETPEDENAPNLVSLIISFILAIALISILMKYKWKFVIRLWFLFVVSLSLGIAINAFLSYTNIVDTAIIALTIAIPLAIIKILRPDVFIHNITELLIYPGIAVIFVPILNPVTVITLLILISLYDAWAVWKSGLMQKMAKFQMEEVKIFGGFLIPTTDKKTKDKIRRIKQKYRGKKIPEKVQKQKFKVNLAILGGGDVVFPIITAGVFLRAFPEKALFGVPGLAAALLIVAGAFVGLTYLMFNTKKGKAYPAMPYISSGIFLGALLTLLI